jgi:regulation of enolase protein 1 (concanavalin A-like superfamily)
MINKKIFVSLISVGVVVASAAMFAAFEAHVINVTAKIENALYVDSYGIDFGTVFPQEYITDEDFTVGLSDSFKAQNRATTVNYKIVQKDKDWTLNFGEGDIDPHNRSLLCIDPDTTNLAERCVIDGNKLTIKTDTNNAEDLFGVGEVFGDITAPRALYPMGGNFTIETKVTANPTSSYQAGGILVYGSDGNVVRLELTNWGDANNAIYMESQENGVKTAKRWTLGIIPTDTVYLKITRSGNVFKGYYKQNVLDVWTEVPYAEGETDVTNEFVGNQPKVGVSAVDAPSHTGGFSAEFDYVTFNGDYLSLCRFLSKTKGADGTETGDVEHPSYYTAGANPGTDDDSCIAVNATRTEASGVLGGNDTSDTWVVDLKVPPISGYVAQDWPDSCAGWMVEENEADYGCDLWVEVTGVQE